MLETKKFLKLFMLIFLPVLSCKPLKGKIDGKNHQGSKDTENIPINETLKISKYSTIEHLDGVLNITRPSSTALLSETDLKERMRKLFLEEGRSRGTEFLFTEEQNCINELIAKIPANVEKEHEIHYQAHIDLQSCLKKFVVGTFYLDINFWFFCEKGNLVTSPQSLDGIGTGAITRLCAPGLISVLLEREFEQDLVVNEGSLKNSVFKTSYKDVFAHQDGNPCLGQLLDDKTILFADGCQKTIFQKSGEETSYSQEIFKGILGTWTEPFHRSGSVTLTINDWQGSVNFEQESSIQTLNYEMTKESTKIQDSLKKMPVLNFVHDQQNTLSQFIIEFLPQL